MNLPNKTISLIIPVFNEEKNIPILYGEILKSLKEIGGHYQYELIFIDDGSSDQSREKVRAFSKDDPRVKLLGFSRNFGKEIATTAGIHYASGDAAIMLDADLQHPPEILPQFIKEWEQGAEMVIGVRKNKGSGIFRRLFAALFYKILSKIGKLDFMPYDTDFRLIDKKIITAFHGFREHNRMTRGLLNWLGFKRSFIYFSAPKRKHGKPAYNSLKLFKLALSGFVSHSLLPLKLAGYLGLIIVFIAGPFGLYILLGKYLLHWPFASSFTGPAQLAILIIFLVGIILTGLGLIALYIATIHDEVLARPLYVISEKENLEDRP